MKNRVTGPLSGAFKNWRYSKSVATGDAARANKDWQRAYTAYQDAVAIMPNAAPIWVQLGHAAKEFGQLDAAEKAYATANRLVPDDIDVQIQLGHLFKETGQSAKALALYKAAVSAGATDVHATDYLFQNAVARANGARKNRLYKTAIQFLREACTLRPDHEVWIELGDWLRESDDVSEARLAYENALSLQPDNVDCMRRIEQLDQSGRRATVSESETATLQIQFASPPEIPAVTYERRHTNFSENVAAILDQIQTAYSRRMA